MSKKKKSKARFDVDLDFALGNIDINDILRQLLKDTGGGKEYIFFDKNGRPIGRYFIIYKEDK